MLDWLPNKAMAPAKYIGDSSDKCLDNRTNNRLIWALNNGFSDLSESLNV